MHAEDSSTQWRDYLAFFTIGQYYIFINLCTSFIYTLFYVFLYCFEFCPFFRRHVGSIESTKTTLDRPLPVNPLNLTTYTLIKFLNKIRLHLYQMIFTHHTFKKISSLTYLSQVPTTISRNIILPPSCIFCIDFTHPFYP